MAVIEKFHHHNDKISGNSINGSGEYSSVGGTGTAVFADIGSGNIVARYQCATGATALAAYATDTFTATSMFSVAGRFTLRQAPAAWTVAREIMQIRAASKAVNALLDQVRVFRVRDAADSIVAQSAALSYDVPHIFQIAGQIGTTTTDGKIRCALSLEDGTVLIPDTESITKNVGTANLGSFISGMFTTSTTGGGIDFDDIHWMTDTYDLIQPYQTVPTANHTEKNAAKVDFSESAGTGLTLSVTQQSGPAVVLVVNGLVCTFDEVDRTTPVVLAYTLTDTYNQTASGTVSVPPPTPPTRTGPLYAHNNQWN